jgi:hypothetical protein
MMRKPTVSGNAGSVVKFPQRLSEPLSNVEENGRKGEIKRMESERKSYQFEDNDFNIDVYKHLNEYSRGVNVEFSEYCAPKFMVMQTHKKFTVLVYENGAQCRITIPGDNIEKFAEETEKALKCYREMKARMEAEKQ